MGQTLSEPVTETQSSVTQDSRFLVAASCMQGWRVSMEDSHTAILSLPQDPHAAFFAVYDGHGGSAIANYAGKHLHHYVLQRPEYEAGDIPQALHEGFLELDAAMEKEESLRMEEAGTTAVVVLVKGDSIYCANVGDSRAVLCVAGEAVPLSVDHKPNNADELKRIRASGGYVEFNRVNGNLALSRALGDFGFKKNRDIPARDQIVTAYPDVEVHTISDDCEFLIIACDGIWDILSSQEAVNFCRHQLMEGVEPKEVCEKLMQVCLAPISGNPGVGYDNMTVLLVCFIGKDSTLADLQEKMRKTPYKKPSINELALVNAEKLSGGDDPEVEVEEDADKLEETVAKEEDANEEDSLT